MRRISIFCAASCAAGLLALLAGPARAQDRVLDPDALIHWESNLDAAFLDARKNNVPVLIVFHSEANPYCRQLMNDIYSDPEVVRESRKFICLAGCPDEHPDAVVKDAEGTYRTVCEYFLYVTCAEHQRIWDKARRVFFSNEAIEVPQHLFVHPDGTMISKDFTVKKPADLIKAMKDVFEKMEPDRDDPLFQAVDEDERKFVTELRRLKGADASLRRFILDKLVRWEGAWVYPKLGRYIEEAAGPAEAVHIIRAMGFKENRRGVDFLLLLSRHADPEVRLHAAVSLEMVSLESAAGEIRKWIDREKDDQARAALLRALASCDPGNPATLAFLEKEIKSGQPQMRRNAAVALGIVGAASPESVRASLEALVSDNDEYTAACACWALGWMRSGESLDLLIRRMETADSYRMIILLEDAVNRAMGRDPFGYMRHLEKYAGDTIIRGEKWPPERRDWGL